MPALDGLAATKLLRASDHEPEVIVLPTFEADDYVLRALGAGASRFLLKHTARRRRRLERRGRCQPAARAGILSSGSSGSRLTS